MILEKVNGNKSKGNDERFTIHYYRCYTCCSCNINYNLAVMSDYDIIGYVDVEDIPNPWELEAWRKEIENSIPINIKPEKVDAYVNKQIRKRSKRKRRAAKRRKVLKAIVNNPIVNAVITLTPKPVQNMFKWLKERLVEPSTYQGIAAVAGAIGVSISPELFEAIASTAVAVIGLIQIIKKEKASDSAEEGN